jgi:dihydroflavonol-4-reductase
MDWNFGSFRAPYYDTKREGEGRVLEFVDRGLDVVVVNPGYIIGPWDVKPSSGQSIIDILARRIPGYPSRGGIAFVDVREVVEGMTRAMECGKTGERYLLVGENLSYKEYADMVSEIGGAAPLTRSLPAALVYSVSVLTTALGWMGYRRWGDVNLTLAKVSFCDHYATSAKAREQLGVTPYPIRTAIADTITWFEEHGYLRRVDRGWRATRPGR